MQHEFDQKKKKMYIDHLTPFRKQIIQSKQKNLLKGKFQCSYRTKAVRK